MQYHFPKRVVELVKKPLHNIGSVEVRPTSTSVSDSQNLDLEKTDTYNTVRTIGRLTLRGVNDDLPQ
jgi:hypothetical protein